jgi:hypothetical protein
MSSQLERVFLVVVLGLLLIIIGSGVDVEWLWLIGSLLFTVSLIWAGLFLSGESMPLRITLLAIAGLVVINLISSGSSYLPSF